MWQEAGSPTLEDERTLLDESKQAQEEHGEVREQDKTGHFETWTIKS